MDLGVSDVCLNAYFSQTVMDDVLLLDRVKMHYNLVLFSHIEESFKQELWAFTYQFIENHFNHSVVYKHVNEQLSRICDDQLRPRYDLISMLVRHFDWT